MRKYYNGNVDVQKLVRNRKHMRFFFFSFFHFHEHNVFQATLRKTPPKTKTKKSEKQNKINYGQRFNYSVLAPK